MIKHLVFGLLLSAVAVVLVEPVANETEVGKSEPVDCHSCYCKDTGLWYTTDTACLNISEATSSQNECKDDDTTSFDNGCNNCTCVNGNWACTRKSCIEAAPYQSSMAKTEASAPKECESNSKKQEDCNSCWCTEAGLWACTKKDCPEPKHEAPSLKECEPHLRYEERCNCRWRSDSGVWARRWKACPKDISDIPPLKECDFHLRYEERCNCCWRSASGVWACKFNSCPTPKPEATAAGFKKGS